MRLDPERTFKTLVVGASNQKAVDLVRQTLGRKPTRPSLVLLVGPSGTGKTHLLQAAANELLKRRPSARIRMFTAEAFANIVVADLRRGRRTSLLASITGECDALIVDEVEDLDGKARILAALRTATVSLRNRGKPVILALGDRLKADGGGVGIVMMISEFGKHCGIELLQMPTKEMRVAALRQSRRVRRNAVAEALLLRVAQRDRSVAAARAALDRELIAQELALAAKPRRNGLAGSAGSVRQRQTR